MEPAVVDWPFLMYRISLSIINISDVEASLGACVNTKIISSHSSCPILGYARSATLDGAADSVGGFLGAVVLLAARVFVTGAWGWDVTGALDD